MAHTGMFHDRPPSQGQGQRTARGGSPMARSRGAARAHDVQVNVGRHCVAVTRALYLGSAWCGGIGPGCDTVFCSCKLIDG